MLGPMFTQEVVTQEVQVKKFKFKSTKPILATNENFPDDPFNTSFPDSSDFDEIEAQATSITFEGNKIVYDILVPNALLICDHPDIFQDYASNKGAETNFAHVKVAPVKVAPVKDAPVKDTLVKDAPVEDTPTKDAPVKDAPVKDTPTAQNPLIKDAPVTKLVTENISTQIVTTNNDDNVIVARKKATIDAQVLQLKMQRAMNINLLGRLIENEQKIAMKGE